MRVFYTPFYYAEIGQNHVFPIRKFELVRNKLVQEGTLRPADLIEPAPVDLSDVLLVHTQDYVTRLCEGRLTSRELRRLGLPWSESLVRRSFYAVGGTVAASHAAIEEGIGSNLAGGTHHAFADRGEGFCVLNDVAIAICSLRRNGVIKRAAVIDCDVHQGNGTATIFFDDDDVFTFSMHGARNYPLLKARSTLDIELADGTGDESYLSILNANLHFAMQHAPNIVFYLAGADPYRADKLGRLGLTIQGLRRRDEMVLLECYQHETPVVTVMSGGYGENIQDTIEIHCNTIRAAYSVYETGPRYDYVDSPQHIAESPCHK